jgi:hypothetical protein
MRYYRSCFLGFFAAVLVSGNVAADPLRYRAQPERARTWLIETDQLFLDEAGKPRRVMELSGWQWAGPSHACPPDVAFGPRGEAIVTSNVLPVLWKIDPETLAVSVHRLQLSTDEGRDVGFSALVYSEREGAYFAVSEQHASLWRIDPLLLRAEKIAVSEKLRGGCVLSPQNRARLSRFGRLCVNGRSESRLINLAPDQRAAYVQPRACASEALALIGGLK